MNVWKRLAGMPLFMLDHFWTKAHMSGAIDGQLGPGDRSRFRRHLDECESCHLMLKSLRQTVGSLGALIVPSDPGVADRVIERLDEVSIPADEAGGGSGT